MLILLDYRSRIRLVKSLWTLLIQVVHFLFCPVVPQSKCFFDRAVEYVKLTLLLLDFRYNQDQIVDIVRINMFTSNSKNNKINNELFLFFVLFILIFIDVFKTMLLHFVMNHLL